MKRDEGRLGVQTHNKNAWNASDAAKGLHERESCEKEDLKGRLKLDVSEFSQQKVSGNGGSNGEEP